MPGAFEGHLPRDVELSIDGHGAQSGLERLDVEFGDLLATRNGKTAEERDGIGWLHAEIPEQPDGVAWRNRARRQGEKDAPLRNGTRRQVPAIDGTIGKIAERNGFAGTRRSHIICQLKDLPAKIKSYSQGPMRHARGCQ